MNELIEALQDRLVWKTALPIAGGYGAILFLFWMVMQ